MTEFANIKTEEELFVLLEERTDDIFWIGTDDPKLQELSEGIQLTDEELDNIRATGILGNGMGSFGPVDPKAKERFGYSEMPDLYGTNHQANLLLNDWYGHMEEKLFLEYLATHKEVHTKLFTCIYAENPAEGYKVRMDHFEIEDGKLLAPEDVERWFFEDYLTFSQPDHLIITVKQWSMPDTATWDDINNIEADMTATFDWIGDSWYSRAQL